jgi:hypothetical protein
LNSELGDNIAVSDLHFLENREALSSDSVDIILHRYQFSVLEADELLVHIDFLSLCCLQHDQILKMSGDKSAQNVFAYLLHAPRKPCSMFLQPLWNIPSEKWLVLQHGENGVL